MCGGCERDERRPTFQYTQDNACADVTALAWSEDRREEIVVDVDLSRIGHRVGGTYHIRISDSGPATVRVNLYPSDEHLPYCSDKIPNPMPQPAVWVARSGVARVSLASAPPVPYPPGPYRVEVLLEDLVLVGPEGQIIEMPPIRRFGGFGGWIPG
jgi:hypothetical protein